MGAMSKYFQIDTSDLFDLSDPNHSVSCKALKDGTMEADGIILNKDGGILFKTTTIGTPDRFRGVSLFFVTPKDAPAEERFDSYNYLDSIVGNIGQQELLHCWPAPSV